jgi:hypothetical protein
MTREQVDNLTALTDVLRRNLPDDGPNVPRAALAIHKMARSLHKLAEARCNGDLTTRQEKRELNLERDVAALLLACGATVVHHHGDPRGYAVKAVFPSGDFNTWGGKEDGFGIG